MGWGRGEHMAERLRSLGAMLITAPTEHERLYAMAVRITRQELVALPGYALSPWLTIRANLQTGAVEIAAGVKAKRLEQP